MDHKLAVLPACIDVLRREIALLERLAAAQEIVRRAVYAREWTDLEAMLNRLDGYGRDFAELEAERVETFRFLGGRRDGGDFYASIARLPDAERRELAELHRRLKLDALKVRLANDALTAYLAEARTTVGAFLDAAFPDRRGKLYSRRGTAVPAEMRSLVLNRSL
jgi:hypothetical protein